MGKNICKLPDKFLISTIYQQVNSTTTTKQPIWLRNGLRTSMESSPKNKYNDQQINEKNCWKSLVIREIQIKATWNITSLLSEWLLSKRWRVTSAGEFVQTRELLYIGGGNATTVEISASTVENSAEIRIRFTTWSSNPTMDWHEHIVSKRNLCYPKRSPCL